MLPLSKNSIASYGTDLKSKKNLIDSDSGDCKSVKIKASLFNENIPKHVNPIPRRRTVAATANTLGNIFFPNTPKELLQEFSAVKEGSDLFLQKVKAWRVATEGQDITQLKSEVLRIVENSRKEQIEAIKAQPHSGENLARVEKYKIEKIKTFFEALHKAIDAEIDVSKSSDTLSQEKVKSIALEITDNIFKAHLKQEKENIQVPFSDIKQGKRRSVFDPLKNVAYGAWDVAHGAWESFYSEGYDPWTDNWKSYGTEKARLKLEKKNKEEILKEKTGYQELQEEIESLIRSENQPKSLLKKLEENLNNSKNKTYLHAPEEFNKMLLSKINKRLDGVEKIDTEIAEYLTWIVQTECSAHIVKNSEKLSADFKKNLGANLDKFKEKYDPFMGKKDSLDIAKASTERRNYTLNNREMSPISKAIEEEFFQEDNTRIQHLNNHANELTQRLHSLIKAGKKKSFLEQECRCAIQAFCLKDVLHELNELERSGLGGAYASAEDYFNDHRISNIIEAIKTHTLKDVDAVLIELKKQNIEDEIIFDVLKKIKGFYKQIAEATQDRFKILAIDKTGWVDGKLENNLKQDFQKVIGEHFSHEISEIRKAMVELCAYNQGQPEETDPPIHLFGVTKDCDVAKIKPEIFEKSLWKKLGYNWMVWTIRMEQVNMARGNPWADQRPQNPCNPDWLARYTPARAKKEAADAKAEAAYQGIQAPQGLEKEYIKFDINDFPQEETPPSSKPTPQTDSHIASQQCRTGTAPTDQEKQPAWTPQPPPKSDDSSRLFAGASSILSGNPKQPIQETEMSAKDSATELIHAGSEAISRGLTSLKDTTQSVVKSLSESFAQQDAKIYRNPTTRPRERAKDNNKLHLTEEENQELTEPSQGWGNWILEAGKNFSNTVYQALDRNFLHPHSGPFASAIPQPDASTNLPQETTDEQRPPLNIRNESEWSDGMRWLNENFITLQHSNDTSIRTYVYNVKRFMIELSLANNDLMGDIGENPTPEFIQRAQHSAKELRQLVRTGKELMSNFFPSSVPVESSSVSTPMTQPDASTHSEGKEMIFTELQYEAAIEDLVHRGGLSLPREELRSRLNEWLKSIEDGEQPENIKDILLNNIKIYFSEDARFRKFTPVIQKQLATEKMALMVLFCQKLDAVENFQDELANKTLSQANTFLTEKAQQLLDSPDFSFLPENFRPAFQEALREACSDRHFKKVFTRIFLNLQDPLFILPTLGQLGASQWGSEKHRFAFAGMLSASQMYSDLSSVIDTGDEALKLGEALDTIYRDKIDSGQINEGEQTDVNTAHVLTGLYIDGRDTEATDQLEGDEGLQFLQETAVNSSYLAPHEKRVQEYHAWVKQAQDLEATRPELPVMEDYWKELLRKKGIDPDAQVRFHFNRIDRVGAGGLRPQIIRGRLRKGKAIDALKKFYGKWSDTLKQHEEANFFLTINGVDITRTMCLDWYANALEESINKHINVDTALLPLLIKSRTGRNFQLVDVHRPYAGATTRSASPGFRLPESKGVILETSNGIMTRLLLALYHNETGVLESLEPIEGHNAKRYILEHSSTFFPDASILVHVASLKRSAPQVNLYHTLAEGTRFAKAAKEEVVNIRRALHTPSILRELIKWVPFGSCLLLNLDAAGATNPLDQGIEEDINNAVGCGFDFATMGVPLVQLGERVILKTTQTLAGVKNFLTLKNTFNFVGSVRRTIQTGMVTSSKLIPSLSSHQLLGSSTGPGVTSQILPRAYIGFGPMAKSATWKELSEQLIHQADPVSRTLANKIPKGKIAHPPRKFAHAGQVGRSVNGGIWSQTLLPSIFNVEGSNGIEKISRSNVQQVGPFGLLVIEEEGKGYQLIRQSNGKYKKVELTDPFDILDFEHCQSIGRRRRGLDDICQPSVSGTATAGSSQPYDFPAKWLALIARKKIYRGDNRLPSAIFEDGFRSRGGDVNLNRHLSFSNRNSGFISTTFEKKVAAKYALGSTRENPLFELEHLELEHVLQNPQLQTAGTSKTNPFFALGRSTTDPDKGYLYKIYPNQNMRGIDILEHFPADIPAQNNQEIAVLGHIPPQTIKGAYLVTGLRSNPKIGSFTNNPNFIET